MKNIQIRHILSVLFFPGILFCSPIKGNLALNSVIENLILFFWFCFILLVQPVSQNDLHNPSTVEPKTLILKQRSTLEVYHNTYKHYFESSNGGNICQNLSTSNNLNSHRIAVLEY